LAGFRAKDSGQELAVKTMVYGFMLIRTICADKGSKDWGMADSFAEGILMGIA
jgi:hypothetical protein